MFVKENRDRRKKEVEILSSLLFPVYNSDRGSTQPGKYVRHHFGKGKRLWWNSKHNERLSRSSRSKRFYEKGVLRNLPKFTRKHLHGNLFFNKVKCCGFSTSFKTRLQNKLFLKILRNLLEHSFCRTPQDDCF